MLGVDNPAEVAVDLGARVVQIEAGDADMAETAALLRRGVRVGNESLEADAHLYELIPKPWGQEYRVYADDLLDVWHLRIDPGHRTSMHVHPRKTTYLLCLAGEGVTQTLNGPVRFTPGTILRIAKGAFHSTENVSDDEPLMVVEVETPRNKHDLMRLRDGYSRAGLGYETRTGDVGLISRKVSSFPGARLTKLSPCGGYSFDILSGMDVHYRRHSAGSFLVPLSVAEIIGDRMTILTDHESDVRKPTLDGYYLSIRRAA